jgi:hypothetical protein
MRGLSPSSTPFERALARIDCPTARKLVVMSKWERGELSASEAERLIHKLGLVSA